MVAESQKLFKHVTETETHRCSYLSPLMEAVLLKTGR